MSLQAWYKLNGDAKNYGLGDLELTQVNAPAWGDGKITKQSLTAGGYKWTAAQSASIFNNEEFSYACWFMSLGTTGSNTEKSMIFGNTDLRYFSLFQYPTCNDLHWYWHYNDSKSYTDTTISGVLPSNIWTHICVTYKKGKNYIYINGILKQTNNITMNITDYAKETTVIHNSAYHRIQDIRIYNHCLTQQEVTEISQGLMCHYRMTGNGNPNYFSSYDTAARTLSNLYYSDIRMYFDTTLWQKSDYKNGLSLQFDWKISKGLDANHGQNVYFDGNNGSSTVYPMAGTFTIPKNVTSGHAVINNIKSYTGYSTFTANNIFVRMGNASKAAWVSAAWPWSMTLSNCKIEQGSACSPYLPHSGDSKYNSMGYNSLVEKDCTGLANKGTLAKQLVNNAESPMNKSCYYFDGTSNSYISLNNFYNTSTTDFTISCWIKKIDDTNFEPFVSRTSYPYGIMIVISNNYVVFDDGARWQCKNFTTPIKNNWHLITVTRTTTAKKVYIDGILYDSTTTVGKLANFLNIAYIGNNYSNTGFGSDWAKTYISDLRFYATALNDTAIMALYNKRKF